jgi:hypothetical protein
MAASVAVYASGLDMRMLLEAQSAEDMQKIDRDALAQFMMITVLAMLPINAALWFAPALVVFADAGSLQALRMSLFAWTRNVLAVLVYSITLFALFIVCVILLMPLILVGGGAAQNVVAMIALVPITAVYMISDYVCYRRVFHRSERLQASAEAS